MDSDDNITQRAQPIYSDSPPDTGRYRIVRMYQHARCRKRIIDRGLTLAEAQAHCRDPQTSSRTATTTAAKRRTAGCGPWFDGYECDR